MLIEEIKKLIAKDKTDQVLRELLDADLDEEMKHSVLLLSARWNSIRKDNMNGILSGDEWILNKSKINHSLLQLLNDLSKETDTIVKKGADTGNKLKENGKTMSDKFNKMDVDVSANIMHQDNFLGELNEKDIDAAKNRIKDLKKLLQEYKDLLKVEEDPKRKMKYQMEIKNLEDNILFNETELKVLLNKRSYGK